MSAEVLYGEVSINFYPHASAPHLTFGLYRNGATSSVTHDFIAYTLGREPMFTAVFGQNTYSSCMTQF